MSVDKNPPDVNTLAAMLGDLSEIKMHDWYQYAFSGDPLNGRFTDEQKKTWMGQAIECGSRYSERICESYHIQDPRLLAKAMGIRVSSSIEDISDRLIFAQYIEPNQIRMNNKVVRRAEDYVKTPAVAAALPAGLNVGDLILAHELFHHVENLYRDEIFTQKKKLRLWSLGPFHSDSKIMALSEIAAMSFAREMTDTCYSPYLLDVLLIYGQSPSDAVELYREMLKDTGRKSGM